MLLNIPFHTFSLPHIGMLIFLGILTLVFIEYGKRSDPERQLNIAIIIAGLTFSSELIEMILLIFEGTYDFRTDLPIYLCDISALILPFVLFRQNRKWIGILYFWALAGTLQALITPDVEDGFPSFDFFRYFLMHGGIVMAILYTVIVFKIRITWKDFIRAVVYAQVYLVCIHIVNHFLQSNYSYTLQKPPGPTILDYLGPWPWYLLAGEGIMLILFFLLLLPYLGKPTKGSIPSDGVSIPFGTE